VGTPIDEETATKNSDFTYRSNSLHNGRVMSFGYDVEPVTDNEITLLLDQIEESDPDVIGISTRSFFMDFGEPVMRRIRERFPDKIFVSGGFGPAFDPEWFLQWSDYVAFGEYDSSLNGFLDTVDQKGPLSECPGFIFLGDDGQMVRNEITPVDTNLDELPFPDWDDENKHLIQYDRIVSGAKFQHHEAYNIMVGRGCLGSCSYCMAWKWRDMYQSTYGMDIKKCRLRSPKNIIDELKIAKEDGANFITFVDPTLWGPREWFEELQERYIAEIGLPFQANCHPQFTNDETLKLLIDMGLKRTCVGIQSGSERIRADVFNRKISNKKMLSFCQNLDQHGVLYDFHIIGWNPFESMEDYENSLELFLKMKSGIDTNVFRLAIFPGSMLYNTQSNLTRIDLDDDVHQYFAYLFSFVFNNEESRKLAVALHDEDRPLVEKIALLKSKKGEMLKPSYVAGPMAQMIFPPDSPRNRLISAGFSNREAKEIAMDHDNTHIKGILDELDAKIKESDFLPEDRRGFLSQIFQPALLKP